MNSFKTLFIIAILGAVAYGAYLSMTHKQELAEPGTEAPPFMGPAASQSPGSPAPQFGSGAPTGGMPAGPQGQQTAPLAVTAVPNAQYASQAGGPSVPFPSDPTASVAASLPQGVLPFPASPVSGASPVKKVSYGSSTDRPSPPSGSPTASHTPGDSPGSVDKYTASIGAVQKQLDTGQLKQAHLALTDLYNQPDLRPYQRSQIIKLLDQLAGHVIYSREHLLEPPYLVRAGDTLQSIARSHNVPSQLLANINGIGNRQLLWPGQRLKVVRGPFHAIVNLSDYELTLMVGGRYAGRFAIGVGEDCARLTKSQTFLVSGKTTNPTYYGPGNQQIKPGNPDNPFGSYHIGLSEPNGAPTRISIHGTNSRANLHQAGGRGSICLDAKDIKDIFGILSAGPVPPSPGGPIASKVTIIR